MAIILLDQKTIIVISKISYLIAIALKISHNYAE